MPVPAARMLAAARIIANAAKTLAAGWSEQIPPSMRIHIAPNVATIVSQVGPSYPNEVKGVRHPVFGHRERKWVTNQYRPFLAPAADAKADAAAEEIGMSIDDLCIELGFHEE